MHVYIRHMEATHMKHSVVINIGDKFSDGRGNIWEVIDRFPGGKLDMLDRKRTYFCTRYHKDVIQWERVA
jgi:hypothetical protein